MTNYEYILNECKKAHYGVWDERAVNACIDRLRNLSRDELLRLTVDVPLAFFCNHLCDNAFCCSEVVLHLVGAKERFALLEDRVPVDVADGIGHAAGIQFLRREAELDEVGMQLQVLIVNDGLTEKVGHTVLDIHHNGVLRVVSD